MSFIQDLLQKQKFLAKIVYNGSRIFQRTAAVKGQTAIYDKGRKLAYLLPENAKPVKEGNRNVLYYDVNDSCPLADLKDIIPDQIKEFELQISEEIQKQIIDLVRNPPATPEEQAAISKYKTLKEWYDQVSSRIKANPPDGNFDQVILDKYNEVKTWLEKNPPPKPKLSKDDEKQFENVVIWLKDHEGTAILYQLWRYGYLKGESWYRKLRDKPKIDRLVFPKKIERVGVRPLYFFEREQAVIVPDIIRRPESKWGWLEPVLTALIIGFVVICVAYFIFK